MRYIYISFVLLYVHQSALADTPGKYIGKNSKGVTFSIGMDVDGHPPGTSDGYWIPAIGYYDVKNIYNPLPRNCSFRQASNGDIITKAMECEEDTSTPLSKVKYRALPTSSGTSKILHCIEGCSSVVPNEFKYHPTEDNDEPQ